MGKFDGHPCAATDIEKTRIFGYNDHRLINREEKNP